MKYSIDMPLSKFERMGSIIKNPFPEEEPRVELTFSFEDPMTAEDFFYDMEKEFKVLQKLAIEARAQKS